MAVLHEDKKIFWGVIIFVVGLAWYAQDTGLIKLEPFWPIVLMLIGLLFVLKGVFGKQKTRRR